MILERFEYSKYKSVREKHSLCFPKNTVRTEVPLEPIYPIPILSEISQPLTICLTDVFFSSSNGFSYLQMESACLLTPAVFSLPISGKWMDSHCQGKEVLDVPDKVGTTENSHILNSLKMLLRMVKSLNLFTSKLFS